MSSNWINPVLGEWLSSLLHGAATAPASGEVPVTFGVPGADGGPPAQGRPGRGLNLHLLSIAPHEQATTRNERRTEARLVLRYLITAWADKSDVADSMLTTLAFGLLGKGAHGPDGQSEVAIEAAPTHDVLDVLRALGVPPRAALVMALPLVYVDEPAPARRVLHPPIVNIEPAAALWGRVVGPEDGAIASAQVEFPSLGLVTQTDPEGVFRFARVPADTKGQTIKVRARGVVRIFELSALGADRSVTLQMTFGEEA